MGKVFLGWPSGLLSFADPMPSVLIVDDLVSIHEMLDAVIQPNGFSTAFATDGEKGLERYKAGKFDIVLADIDMKPMDGITLLKNLRLFDPAAVVILITAYASTDSAIQALKHGAFDYIAKPFKVDELIKALRRGLEFREANLKRKAAEAAGVVATPERSTASAPPLLGGSPKVKRLQQQLTKLVSARSAVLIQGELGTGKRTIAEWLHHTGPAKDRPFVVVDCSAPEAADLGAQLSSGAGAPGPLKARVGGGTLFLQNIQSLSREQQDALTPVLQGSDLGFRLICASTEDLEALMNEGRISEELFYRIASLPLVVPALRERPEDIPQLVRHYTHASANPGFDVHQIEFTDDALKLLSSYRWPGNLLELQQVVAKAVAATETRVITAAQLPLRLNQLREWPTLAEYLAGQRRQYVATVLHACRDDRKAAAEVLGIEPSEIGS